MLRVCVVLLFENALREKKIDLEMALALEKFDFRSAIEIILHYTSNVLVYVQLINGVLYLRFTVVDFFCVCKRQQKRSDKNRARRSCARGPSTDSISLQSQSSPPPPPSLLPTLNCVSFVIPIEPSRENNNKYYNLLFHCDSQNPH